MRSSINKLLALAILVTSRAEPRAVWVVIGGYPIRGTDIALRDKVIRSEFPSEKRSMGLHQLRSAYAKIDGLRRRGVPFTDAMLDVEAERIARETKAPGALARIQRHFEGDPDAYRRVYVLPVYINRLEMALMLTARD